MNLGMKALLTYEEGLADLVLATVVESTPHIGRPPSRSYLAAVLSGSMKTDIVATDGHRLTTFGSLSHLGADNIVALVDKMLAKGLLETVRGRRCLVVTTLGRTFLSREGDHATTDPLGLVPGTVDPNRLDLAVRSGLFEALRRFRAEQAHADDVPEFRVITEAQIRELATRPAIVSLAGVQDVLGEKKGEKYGPALLQIIAEHAPIIERLKRPYTLPPV